MSLDELALIAQVALVVGATAALVMFFLVQNGTLVPRRQVDLERSVHDARERELVEKVDRHKEHVERLERRDQDPMPVIPVPGGPSPAEPVVGLVASWTDGTEPKETQGWVTVPRGQMPVCGICARKLDQRNHHAEAVRIAFGIPPEEM